MMLLGVPLNGTISTIAALLEKLVFLTGFSETISCVCLNCTLIGEDADSSPTMKIEGLVPSATAKADGESALPPLGGGPGCLKGSGNGGGGPGCLNGSKEGGGPGCLNGSKEGGGGPGCLNGSKGGGGPGCEMQPPETSMHFIGRIAAAMDDLDAIDAKWSG